MRAYECWLHQEYSFVPATYQLLVKGIANCLGRDSSINRINMVKQTVGKVKRAEFHVRNEISTAPIDVFISPKFAQVFYSDLIFFVLTNLIGLERAIFSSVYVPMTNN